MSFVVSLKLQNTCLCNAIASYSSFQFQGQILDDIWCLDSCIPLNDRTLVELVRGAVFWTI